MMSNCNLARQNALVRDVGTDALAFSDSRLVVRGSHFQFSPSYLCACGSPLLFLLRSLCMRILSSRALGLQQQSQGFRSNQ